jgi:hypothetical protein
MTCIIILHIFHFNWEANTNRYKTLGVGAKKVENMPGMRRRKKSGKHARNA